MKLLFQKKKSKGIPAPKQTKIRVSWDKLDEPEAAASFEEAALKISEP
jgi:hypothetical protein